MRKGHFIDGETIVHSRFFKSMNPRVCFGSALQFHSSQRNDTNMFFTTANILKRILLVIPIHNRQSELNELLISLTKLNCKNIDLQIVIVDDGSTPPIHLNLFENLKVSLFRNEVSKGPAYCKNIATRAFNGDYIWFLDSDTEIIDSQILITMMERIESGECMAGTGGVIEKYKGERRIMTADILTNFLFVYKPFPPEDYKPCYVKSIGTNNLFIKRCIFQAAGGFSEILPRDEDNDLCLSVSRLGYHFYQDAHTMVLHKFSDSGRQSGAFKHFMSPKLYLKDMFETRTNLIYKYKPLFLLILPFVDTILVPLVFFRVAKGTYTGRIIKVFSNSPLSKLQWLFLITVQSCKCYIMGVFMLIRRFFRQPAK